MAHWEHDDGLDDPADRWDELDPDEEYDRYTDRAVGL